MAAPAAESYVTRFLLLFNPMKGLAFVVRHRDLLRQMLLRNLLSRYKGSLLGFVWSFAHPLLMLGVYTFVFGYIFKARWGIASLGDSGAAFPLIMFCGLAVFNIFSEILNTSTGVIVGNPSYVKKVVFPLELLPLCSVLTSLAFGLAWFLLLFVGTVLLLGQYSWTMLLLPVMLLPLVFLSGGLAFFVASLGVYLRDIQQLVSIATQVLFFMTPIFYPIAAVPERLRWVLQLNPLSTIVEQTRQVFLYGQLPDWGGFFSVLVFSLGIFALGVAWFAKTKKGFADVL